MKRQPQTPNSNRGFNAQFLCMIPRNDALELDGVVASIDNVRIKYTYSKSGYDYEQRDRFDTLTRLLTALTSESLWLEGLFDIQCSREAGFKIGNYMRTISYELPDGNSFAVLVGRYSYNASVKLVEPEIIMDFNPNKIPPEIWQRITWLLAPTACKISVQRFDLAIDLPVCRDQLQLQQRPGSGFQQFISKDGAVTEYTGERSHHAAVKLYDKAADLGLDDLVCTRCEITIDPAKFKGVAQLFPAILSHAPVELSMDFDALPYEVKSVILCPQLAPVLKASVGRNTWAKYRKMIESYGQTYFTLTDDQNARIDRYVRDQLARFISVGTPQYMQSSN